MNEAIAFSVLVVIGLGFWALCGYWGWQRDRLGTLRNMAFNLYVRTGQKTTAFDLLSRRATKAAEQQRMALIRQRECEVGPFQAECACPACTRVGLHWIGIGIPPMRECIFCGHEWRTR